jgi:hypothetical protein
MRQQSEIRPQISATRSRFLTFTRGVRKRSTNQLLKEVKMRKLMTVGVAVLAIGLWLIPIRAAAQGHSVGRPEGSPGVSGSHAPLGAPGSAAGTTHGSAHDSGSVNDGTHGGSKTPDQLLTQNKNLSNNLANLLTKMGVSATPQQACANFKNLGQCVAAIHVANNLKIDFTSLECDMTLKPIAPATSCPTGTGTGTKGMSLGASIDTLKPGTDSKAESKKANTQAKQDIQQSNS